MRRILADVLVMILLSSSTVVDIIVGALSSILIQSRNVIKITDGDISLLWITCDRARVRNVNILILLFVFVIFPDTDSNLFCQNVHLHQVNKVR